MTNQPIEHVKDFFDVVAAGAAVGAFIGMLPTIAAFLAAVYTTCRLVEWFVNKRWRPRRDSFE